MLRPAVAATNCAKVWETSGLGIGDGAPVDGRKPDMAMQGVTDPPKCPGGRRPSTTARKQRCHLAWNEGFRGGCRADPSALRNIPGAPFGAGERGNPWPGLVRVPDKTPLFLRISKAPADIMMMGAPGNTAREPVHAF